MFIVFGCLLSGGLILAWFTQQGLTSAPQISFNIIDGRKIALDELHGRPVMVTFWATTCSGCMKEMPHMIELYNEMAPKGLEIIAVAMSYDPPNQVLELSQRRNIPYPVALDINGSAAKAFGNVQLTPTSFLISPDGKIIKHNTGEMNMTSMRKKITTMLPEQIHVSENNSNKPYSQG